jgi:stage IV sporulation protein B
MNRKSKKILAVLSAVIALFMFSAPTADAKGFETASGNIETLIPGGMAFGVKFFTDGVIVLGTTGVETASGIVSPAKDCGLSAGDIIVRAGGQEFESANELTELIAGSGGKPIVLALIRNGEEKTVSVTPVRDSENGAFRIGILVRDSTAGIGTVTFIDPETNDFGGLGHGIYDSETGMLLPLAKGTVVDVNITDVVKSEKNAPGELHGDFGRTKTGELWDNAEEGVFGRFSKVPRPSMTAIPIGLRSELTEGKAHILTTVSDRGVEEYEVEIEHIYRGSGSTKNFLIKVTDERLLETTGGIVQGMSGSPIIKDGKLIGAVTHVLVNDPEHGYGICIENMLKSAYDASVITESGKLAA